MNLFIVGFKNCGKSTVGKAVAELMQMDFVDVDDVIIKRFGKELTCRQIFTEVGGQAFRELEEQALLEICEKNNQVVATGGGILSSTGNATLMQKSGTICYLQIPWDKLVPRFTRKVYPAYIQGDNPIQELFALYQERSPKYAQLANFQADASCGSSDEIAKQIVEKLSGQ